MRTAMEDPLIKNHPGKLRRNEALDYRKWNPNQTRRTGTALPIVPEEYSGPDPAMRGSEAIQENDCGKVVDNPF
jgi:hypothetical protein